MVPYNYSHPDSILIFLNNRPINRKDMIASIDVSHVIDPSIGKI
jgi:hypothetical protein